jgi:triacylglycerol lipase
MKTYSVDFATPKERLAYCATRHPVILVSGMGFQDLNNIINYWNIIPDYLKGLGCEVYTANQDAFNSHGENALKLKYRILDILERHPHEKVNIIAHSKGGIESRYMISKLGMHDRVASLTTLGSPHHGSGIADIIMGAIPIGKFAVARLVNIYGRIMGDMRPDSYRAARQVTTEAMKRFNDEVIDDSDVYYQSYASHINRSYPSMLWKTLARILYTVQGSNDGLVTIESAKWGDFQGLIATEKHPSTTHADMVGLVKFYGLTDFHAEQFIAHVVHGLKNRGF